MRNLITKLQTTLVRRKLSATIAAAMIVMSVGTFAAVKAPPTAMYSIEQFPLTRYGSPLEQGLRRFPPVHSAIWAMPPLFT